MMKIKLLAMTFAILLIFMGCSKPTPVVIDTTIPSRTGNIPNEVMPSETDMGERGIQIMVEEDNQGYLRLVRITESLTPNDYLKLNLAFQNLSEKPVNGEYRIQFFTQDGLPVEDAIGWNPVALAPRDTKYEEITAPNENAYYYKITVKTEPIQKKY
jgi:uncharacterized protein YcfL